jgi:Fe-S cluster biogenesis protein NfuA
MLTDEAIATAVHETGKVLRADGADLVLVEGNARAARIHVKLELEGANCEDCIVPPDLLESIVSQDLRRALHDEFELIIDDPRREG